MHQLELETDCSRMETQARLALRDQGSPPQLATACVISPILYQLPDHPGTMPVSCRLLGVWDRLSVSPARWSAELLHAFGHCLIISKHIERHVSPAQTKLHMSSLDIGNRDTTTDTGS
jgi:hypothetical protein